LFTPSKAGFLGREVGLGLYFVLSAASVFVANVAPGCRTEVVCLFDLARSGRDAGSCARSFHVFRAGG